MNYWPLLGIAVALRIAIATTDDLRLAAGAEH